jgi:hypothetical protein
VKSVLLLVALALPWPRGEAPRLQLTVARGRALVEVEESAPVTRREGEAPWDLVAPGRVTAPALSEVELRWLGHASATVEGASQAWVKPDLGLVLGHFGAAEIEVRRGRLRLEVLELCTLEAERAVLGIRSLPDGRVELVHRGGLPFRVKADRALTLHAGERVRLIRPPAPAAR